MIEMLKLIPPRGYLLLAVIGLCFGCELHGRHAEAQKWEIREVTANAAAEQKLSDMRKYVAEKEKAAASRLTLIEAQFKQGEDHAQAEIKTLRANVRNGTVRLSIPAVACTGSTMPEAAGNSEGTATEARTELDATTAQSLIDIAAEGDAASRQLNALVDAVKDNK